MTMMTIYFKVKGKALILKIRITLVNQLIPEDNLLNLHTELINYQILLKT